MLAALRRLALGVHARAAIVRLVEAGDPDVMAALFDRQDDDPWSVAMIDGLHHTRRLLTFTYDAGDADAERRMWAALKLVLRRPP